MLLTYKDESCGWSVLQKNVGSELYFFTITARRVVPSSLTLLILQNSKMKLLVCISITHPSIYVFTLLLYTFFYYATTRRRPLNDFKTSTTLGAFYQLFIQFQAQKSKSQKSKQTKVHVHVHACTSFRTEMHERS